VFSNSTSDRLPLLSISPPSYVEDPYGFTLNHFEHLLLSVLPSPSIIRFTKILHQSASPIADWQTSLANGQTPTVFPGYHLTPVSLLYASQKIFIHLFANPEIPTPIVHVTGSSSISCLELYYKYLSLLAENKRSSLYRDPGDTYISQRRSFLLKPLYVDSTSHTDMLF